MVAIRLPLFATFREISILMYAKRVIIPGHVPGEMLVTLASYSNSRAPLSLTHSPVSTVPQLLRIIKTFYSNNVSIFG